MNHKSQKNTTDLTRGSIPGVMLHFALPMIAGNMLQQIYNIADTLVVGRLIGADALAAVGSAYTLMTFLTSVMIGLCMGCGALFSMAFGAGDMERLRKSIWQSFLFIGALTVGIVCIIYAGCDSILALLQVPASIFPLMQSYVRFVFSGILCLFFYNFFAFVLRAVGNSAAPLLFLAISTVTNILLDILFVACFRWGVAGTAAATVIAQLAAGAGITVYAMKHCSWLRPAPGDLRIHIHALHQIA